MATKVLCTPGGHDIFLEQAYWCDRCGFYVCHSHALTSILIDTITCPKRHELIVPGPLVLGPIRNRIRLWN
jgi:hypothetical protein